jgi:hypothetical protein
VTSETPQIQALINQIDEVLSKTSPRLPWVMSSDAAQQRQVLEQTRQYLLSLRQQDGASKPASNATQNSIAATNHSVGSAGSAASAEASAQQVLQAVLQEMTYLRTNMLQPMRSDVEILQRQREVLSQEVRRLELQRQQYMMAQQPPEYLKEFLQATMAQMQDNLSGQVAQVLATLTAQSADAQRLQGQQASHSLGGADLASLSPVERLERLQALQAQSDQLLLRLDSTLRVVFEALQRNLQSYQDSLGEGLGRMHDMGQQGEAVFAAFVTRLAQILGREASSFLQPPGQAREWGDEQQFYGDAARTLPGQDTENLSREDDPDRQITRLLEELNALDHSGLNQEALGEPLPFDPGDPSSPLAPDAELEKLEELDRELSQLDLFVLADEPADVEVNVVSSEDDGFSPFPPFLEGEVVEPSASDFTVGGQNLNVVEPMRSTSDDDLDSALDLLNQVPTPASFFEDEGSELNPTSTAPLSPETEFVSTPDSLYADEFYQDLFGQAETESSEENQSLDMNLSEPDGANELGTQSGIQDEPQEVETAANIDNDLFAGLADPAQEDALETTEPSPFEPLPDAEFPQSVESLLLQQPKSQASSELTLDGFLDEEIPDPMEGIEPEPEDAVETITSLTDLIPEADLVPPSEGGDRPFTPRFDAEDYETAQLGEDLLITEQSTPEVSIRLPADTLQQLTQDLSHLEGATDRPGSSEISNWTLADWTETIDRSVEHDRAVNQAQSEGDLQTFRASDWMVDQSPNDAFPPSAEMTIEELLFSNDFAGGTSSDPAGSDPADANSDLATSFSREERIEQAETTGETGGETGSIEPSTSASPSLPFSSANDALEATIVDWFANIGADPIVTPETSKDDPSQRNLTQDTSTQDTSTQSDASSVFDWQDPPPETVDSNTFTLDGLDSLFENAAPTAPPPRQPSETDTQRITIDDVFSDLQESPGLQSPQGNAKRHLFPPAVNAEVEKKNLEPNFASTDDFGSEVPHAMSNPDVNGTVADLIRDLNCPHGDAIFETDSSATAPSGAPVFDRASPLEESPTPNVAENRTADSELLQWLSSEPTSSAAPNLQAIVPPPLKPLPDESTKGWFLGIDVGTTGISAVLLNPLTEQLYPIDWTVISASKGANDTAQTEIAQSEKETEKETERRFRLPAVVSFVPENQDVPENQEASSQTRSPLDRLCIPISVAETAPEAAYSEATYSNAASGLVQHIKPCLRLGIPYRPSPTAQWEPVLQWSDHQTLPLHWLQKSFQTLLKTLKQPTLSTMGVLTCGALGLDDQAFQNALHQLAGVVVGYPSNWSDTYSFNLREGILQAGLVSQPEQICFLEDTVATLLSVLRRRAGNAKQSAANPAANPAGIILQNADWQGQTLILTAGTTVTELTLVNLPDDLDTLTVDDFQHRSLPFAGNAIDQDIVCQLLYPLLRQPLPADARHLDRIDLALAAVDPAAVNLESLTLPTPGEPDLPNRYALHQRLESSPSGQILLAAARYLKVAFQQQSYFTLQLGDRTWTILRQDLGSKVLLPYVQRLNRELNALLRQAEVTAPEIDQVICTGGTAAMGTIARWLRQKLPNATIVQDTYAHPTIPHENCIFSCSRVAYGLAVLPLYPHLLNVTRHQYSDYFLLMELLQNFPRRPTTAKKLMQILEQNSIDTSGCQSHILALLEGHLPPGLIPSDRDAVLFSKTSLQNPDFYNVQLAPLFQKRGDHYHPNHHQHKQLQQYMNSILANTHQTLSQPYTSTFESLVFDT